MSKLVYELSRYLAWVGGAVLTFLSALSVVSITGRSLSFAGLGPVPGDFELIEAGTALAVFCFLPWCHLRRSHADVGMFWHLYPKPVRHGLALLADFLMLAIWIVLVWRMGVAMLEYRENGEVSFILQMPVWWGYAASYVPALFGCVVYFWRLLESLNLVTPPPGFAGSESAH